jgi:Domain of unknown function (DUF4190)
MTDPTIPPAAQPTPYTAAGAAPAKTNTLAIVALVAAFFVPIAGIICGHIALGQIKRTGENGRPLALWGTILGYVFTAMYVLLILFSILVPLLLVGVGGYSSY